MEVEVRSDFRLALKVRDVNGRTRTVGHYSNNESDASIDTRRVPHLQRVDPSGRWLASYDHDESRVHLYALDGIAKSYRVAIEGGPTDDLLQFRWLADGRGLMLATEDQVYTTALDPDARPTSARLAPALEARDLPFEIQDTRIMDGGVMVRIDERLEPPAPVEPVEFVTGTDLVFGGARLSAHRVAVGNPDYYDYIEAMEYEDGPPTNRRGQVLFVPLTGAAPGTAQALVGSDQTATGAMVLSGGRVVAAVGEFSNELFDGGEASRLQIMTPGPEGWTVDDARDCPDGCPTNNWAPGADMPIRAGWDEIFVEGAERKTLTLPGYGVQVLWADSARDLVLAVTSEAVVLWNGGVEQWRHTTPDDDLHSARFDPTGHYVYAATDGEILRLAIDTGEHDRVLEARAYSRSSETEGSEDNDWVYAYRNEYRRLDGVVPLPGGAVAYAILEGSEETESY